MDRSNRMRERESVRLSIPRVALLVPLLLAVHPAVAAGQHDHPGGPSAAAEAPDMPLLETVLGPYSRPITTRSPLAQAYFDQGMQMVYAFTYSVAIRSFQEAQRQDPQCAMCFWGEALARGPFLNGTMTQANAGPAFVTAQRALSLVDGSHTPAERGLIQAMAVRYAEHHDPDLRAPLDSAYSAAMSEVYRSHQDDLDVGTLYAESIMLLDPVRALYRVDNPFVQSFHRVLEAVLERDITHPGACHLYIHATEATERPDKAEACADLLMTAIPGASHLNHMPSHTYNRLGRWASAVRSNVMAWQSDQRAEFGEGVSYAATHNLHMLFFAGAMDGQGNISHLAAKEYANQVNDGSFYEALVLHRFGRFPEILAMTTVPEQPLQRGLWDFARGYAHLRTGSRDSAEVYLARIDEAAATLPPTVLMRGHTASNLLGITGNLLRAEILRADGRISEAIAAAERAVQTQDGLRYDEPEPLLFSARHWLGALLLEDGRYADAERVYLDSLEQHPHNGWSLLGLEQAIRAQGRNADADRVQERFREAWARSDTVIRSSRF
jgi:tetratricopeptide (TPR) repeat protein